MYGPQDERVVSFKTSALIQGADSRPRTGGKYPFFYYIFLASHHKRDQRSSSLGRVTQTSRAGGEFTYVEQRYKDETKAHKAVIDKLSSLLHKYQVTMPLSDHQREAQMVQDILAGAVD